MRVPCCWCDGPAEYDEEEHDRPYDEERDAVMCPRCERGFRRASHAVSGTAAELVDAGRATQDQAKQIIQNFGGSAK